MESGGQFEYAYVSDASTGETGLGTLVDAKSSSTLVEFDNGSKRWVSNVNLRSRHC